jgi:cardiolipin synthase
MSLGGPNSLLGVKKRERLFPGNHVTFLNGGGSYFLLLLELIRKSEKLIHIQVYILGNDQTGKTILQELVNAAARGVQVFLMVDDYGTSWMEKRAQKELEERGIHVKRFSRRLSFKKFYLGRRQHSKIVVVDNRYALVGGMNLADRYSGWDNNEPWKDFAVLMEGPVAAGLNKLSAVYWSGRQKKVIMRHAPIEAFDDGITVRTSFNDWFRKRNEISRSLYENFSEARSEIFIVAAYFFPSAKMLRLILRKADQGVKIRLVLSAKSDVPFIKPATEYFYAQLLETGVEIYEWNRSVLHGKLAIVDGSWITIGSYNLNQLSDYKSLETNIELSDKKIIRHILDTLKKEFITEKQKVAYKRWRILGSIRSFFSYLLIRLSLKILFLPLDK